MARGAKRARALVACAAGALASFLIAGVADAQTRRTAAQAERDRRSEITRAERLRQEAADVRREVGALDRRIADADTRLASAQAAVESAEARLAELQAARDVETRRQARARENFEAALIAAAFAQRRIEPRATRAGMAAAALAPAFRAADLRSGEIIARAHESQVLIEAEQLALAEAQAAIAGERSQIQTLRAQRQAAQARLAQDATAAEQRARTFAAEARTLQELAERVQAAARRNRTAAAPAAASVIPAGWQRPASGQIARGFGAREGQGSASQGVYLRTSAGARVTAPAAGEVAYADTFRSYGNVLILNLEGGYALVLTGLDSTSVRVGDTVRAGQLVGAMGRSDIAAPELYVEVRRNGQPIDPGRWLATAEPSARRTVQAG